ncbi:hypothetical protein LSH36_76g04006 [Paralvinella palmiformis]|uniref:Ionotropic receptor n=1 Tax=Paralvinella palmiformis TaxID=53620 RepID=A0AAD9NDW6_9ANNE|nr:hypothetical protein LSH36_76g04006 [Paralvinella palmiformis]
MDLTCDTNFDIVKQYLGQYDVTADYINIVVMCSGSITEEIMEAMNYAPFVDEKRRDNKTELFGIEIRILENLAEMFNFTYRFVRSVDGQWGNLVNGVWTGMVGMVYRGDADMAASGISLIESRDEVVDFLTPHYIDSSVVVFKPTRVKWRYFIKPFSQTVWFTILVLPIFITMMLIFILVIRHRYLPLDVRIGFIRRDPSNYRDMIFDYLTKTYGCLFGRGNLTATLAVTDIKEPFKTLDQLADNDDYVLQVLSGTVQMDTFKHAKSGVFKRIWDKISRQPDSIVYNETAAFDRVSQSREITYTGDKLAYLNYISLHPLSGLMLMREEYNPGGMAIVIRERMPYREPMNKAIQQMLDVGLLDYYKSLYLRYSSTSSTTLGPKKDGQPVTLSDLYLVLLYVFAGGLCSASGILILENILKIINCTKDVKKMLLL